MTSNVGSADDAVFHLCIGPKLTLLHDGKNLRCVSLCTETAAGGRLRQMNLCAAATSAALRLLSALMLLLLHVMWKPP